MIVGCWLLVGGWWLLVVGLLVVVAGVVVVVVVGGGGGGGVGVDVKSPLNHQTPQFLIRLTSNVLRATTA